MINGPHKKVGIFSVSKHSNEYYYLFIFFLTIYYSLRTSVLNKYPISIFLIVSFVFAFCKLLTTTYTKKELITIFLLLLFGIINLYFSKSTITLVVVLVIICSKRIDYLKTCKIILYTRIFVIGMLLILSGTGLIENVTKIHNRFENNISRQSLGFEHPNELGKNLILVFMLYLIVYKDEYKEYDYIIFTIINIIQFYFTKSRTSFLVALLLTALLIILRKTTFYFLLNKVSKYIFEIIFIISYILPKYIYPYANGNVFFDKIDSLLQYRLTYSHIFLYKYNLNLFGQKVYNYWSHEYAFLDSGYINLLLGGGILVTILFFYGYIKLIPKLKKSNLKYVILSIVLIAIYGFTENIIYSFYYNFTFIFMGLLIFKNNKLNI